jgi:hypothetical protein
MNKQIKEFCSLLTFSYGQEYETYQTEIKLIHTYEFNLYDMFY